MPLTRALHRSQVDPYKIFLACREIVPAGLHAPHQAGDETLGELTPGSIQYQPHLSPENNYLTDDVLLEVESYFYQVRQDTLDERTEAIKAALKQLFPDLTFAVWIKLVTAGNAADTPDPDCDGDMSMAAALERAMMALDDGRWPDEGTR